MVKTGHCCYQEVLRIPPKFVFQVQIGWWRPGLYSWFVCLWNDRFDGTPGFGVVGEYLGWWKKFEPIRDRWVCFGLLNFFSTETLDQEQPS